MTNLFSRLIMFIKHKATSITSHSSCGSLYRSGGTRVFISSGLSNYCFMLGLRELCTHYRNSLNKHSRKRGDYIDSGILRSGEKDSLTVFSEQPVIQMSKNSYIVQYNLEKNLVIF